LPVETPSLFAQAIQEHLELKQRNALLERQMPIDTYKNEDPFQNHPLFKTEEQARLEETLEGEPAAVAHVEPASITWPGEDTGDSASLEDSIWTKSTREFDWGD
jgi:hypothetical protein